MNFFKLSGTLAAVCLLLASCNQKQPAAPAAPAANEQEAALVIRYVDEDSIMANYNLAKDINEIMIKSQNRYDAAQKQKGNEITRFANTMEQKYKNNQYLSEESFRADQNKLQKMQDDAQNYMANLQQSIENELAQCQQQLLDSIENFMKFYAQKNKLSMVMRKSATLYIDPKFDVTDDVVKGLNDRYNKVGAKPSSEKTATEAKPAEEKKNPLSLPSIKDKPNVPAASNTPATKK